MLELLPFLPFMAVATSAGLLASLWWFRDIPAVAGAISLGWFMVAVYCQFVATGVVAAVGLALQTLLAVYLMARWRLRAK